MRFTLRGLKSSNHADCLSAPPNAEEQTQPGGEGGRGGVRQMAERGTVPTETGTKKARQ